MCIIHEKVAFAKKSKIIYQIIERQRHLIIIGYIYNIYKLKGGGTCQNSKIFFLHKCYL